MEAFRDYSLLTIFALSILFCAVMVKLETARAYNDLKKIVHLKGSPGKEL